MERLNSRLPLFLNKAAARPFCWGEFDCGLWLGEWVQMAMGIDPAAPMRNRYRTREQLMAEFGNVPAARLTREMCRRAGLKRTKDPMLGDIGVIEIPLPRQIVCGAIRGFSGWVVLDGSSGRGLQRVPDDLCRLVMAYRIDEHDAESLHIYSGSGADNDRRGNWESDADRARRISRVTGFGKPAIWPAKPECGTAETKH